MKTKLLLLLLIIPLISQGEPVQYSADKWHTRIFFALDHMGLSTYRGRFTEYEIDFLFDEEDIANSCIEVTVPVSSIDTFSPELNSKMPNEMFFNVDSFPTMHFKSTEINASDDSHATMSGDLTIKGVTLPITFEVTFNKKVFHPRFKLNNVGFSASGQLDSAAYGVNRLPDWMVGPIVQVQIEMEAFEGDKVPYYTE
jgi:polyisoprenoid-binding protein YceI